MDDRRRIEELLKPEGMVIGVPPRPNSNVRCVASLAPVEDARETFERLAKLGHETPDENPSRGSRPGRLVEIPDLGYVGYREASTPTVDVNVSIEGLSNVKFKFVGEFGRESS